MQSLYECKADFRYFEIDHLNRISYIEDQKNEGIYDVVVPPPFISNSKYSAGYKSHILDADSNYIVNQRYASYYGIKSIRIVYDK